MDFGAKVDYKMVGKGGNSAEFVKLRKTLIAMKVDKSLMTKIMRMVVENKEMAKLDISKLIEAAKA